MKILDCHSFDTALSSLAAIADVEPQALIANLRDFNTDDWPDHPPDYLWERFVGGPKSFDGVHWFHFTRTLVPESFQQQGILPLGEMVEPLWSMIFELIGDRQSPAEKAAFRERVASDRDNHSSRLYRMKTERLQLWGPYGMLVRNEAFRAWEIRNHDYLRTPEIIEDICLCHSDWYGGDLLAEFGAKSKPCIVKFFGENNRPDALRTALMFLWCTVHSEGLAHMGNTCFDGQGLPVGREHILNVELVNYSQPNRR